MAVEEAATALTPASLSGDGLDVDLGLEAGFQVVEAADQTATDPGAMTGSTSSAATTMTAQSMSTDESNISSSDSDSTAASEASSDEENTSQAEATQESEDTSQSEATPDSDGPSNSVESQSTASSPIVKVTPVDAKQAGQRVVTTDVVATQQVTETLNLPDLSGVKTPNTNEIANYLQQTMQKIRSGGLP